MIRLVGAAFLAAHGVAHLVGFLGSWRLAEFRDVPYSTLIFDNNFDVGDAGMRVVGILWLLAALSFGWAALAVLLERPHWARTVAATTAASTAICVVGLPAATVGLIVDLAILMVVTAITLQRQTPSEPPLLQP
jgi:hypothetical protein